MNLTNFDDPLTCFLEMSRQLLNGLAQIFGSDIPDDIYPNNL